MHFRIDPVKVDKISFRPVTKKLSFSSVLDVSGLKLYQLVKPLNVSYFSAYVFKKFATITFIFYEYLFGQNVFLNKSTCVDVFRYLSEKIQLSSQKPPYLRSLCSVFCFYFINSVYRLRCREIPNIYLFS